MRICVCAYVLRVSYRFWVKKCEITPQHNKNNRQVIHYYFPFLPCISEQQLTYVSLPAIVRGSGNVRTVVPLFFNPRARFNLHSQLPACLYSFHLAVFFGQPSVPKWPYIGSGTHSGLYFLGDWLWKTNVVIPKCFLCVWGRFTVVCVSCCAFKVVGGAGFKQVEIPLKQDWPDLPKVKTELAFCQSNQGHIVPLKDLQIL